MSYHGDSDDTICVDPRTGSRYHNPCAADSATPTRPHKHEPKTLIYSGSLEKSDEGDGWYY